MPEVDEGHVDAGHEAHGLRARPGCSAAVRRGERRRRGERLAQALRSCCKAAPFCGGIAEQLRLRALPASAARPQSRPLRSGYIELRRPHARRQLLLLRLRLRLGR